MSTADAAQFNKKGSSVGAKSFTEKLDAESLAFFNSVSAKPFADQAMAFLNAYWVEVNAEAEFIYTVSYDKMRYADMHFKGIQLVYSTSCLVPTRLAPLLLALLTLISRTLPSDLT